MRVFISDLKREQKLFLGDYDSYTIIKHGITQDQIVFFTKAALLLYDCVMLPAAFFWQSEEMVRLMPKLEEAIAHGVVLPVIRDSSITRDVMDYFERRVIESEAIGSISAFSQPALASEIASSQNKSDVDALHLINVYAHTDEMSVRETFQRKWNSDLENHLDLNSMFLLLHQGNVTSQEAKAIVDKLKKETSYDQFSRASCINRIQEIIPTGPLQEKLEKRTSWLYLKSSAEAYDCKFYYSQNPYGGMVFEENLPLLLKTLDAVGITRELISRLSFRDIMTLKETEEYKNFIIAYRELVHSVYIHQENVVDIIHRKIINQMRLEKGVSAAYEKLSWIQSNSAAIFCGILINLLSSGDFNQIMGGTLLGIGGVSAASTLLKKLGAINKYGNAQPFLMFKELISAQYEKQIMKMVGEPL